MEAQKLLHSLRDSRISANPSEAPRKSLCYLTDTIRDSFRGIRALGLAVRAKRRCCVGITARHRDVGAGRTWRQVIAESVYGARPGSALFRESGPQVAHIEGVRLRRAREISRCIDQAWQTVPDCAKLGYHLVDSRERPHLNCLVVAPVWLHAPVAMSMRRLEVVSRGLDPE